MSLKLSSKCRQILTLAPNVVAMPSMMMLGVNELMKSNRWKTILSTADGPDLCVLTRFALSLLQTPDIPRYNMARYCTQHSKLEGKTSIKLLTHQRHLYLALSGELWVSIVIYLGKGYCDIISRGKMEHGGKMEHRVFWKKPAWCGSIFTSISFLSAASSASHVKIKLAIDHVFSISRKRNFTFLNNQFIRVLTSIALTN